MPFSDERKTLLLSADIHSKSMSIGTWQPIASATLTDALGRMSSRGLRRGSPTSRKYVTSTCNNAEPSLPLQYDKRSHTYARSAELLTVRLEPQANPPWSSPALPARYAGASDEALVTASLTDTEVRLSGLGCDEEEVTRAKVTLSNSAYDFDIALLSASVTGQSKNQATSHISASPAISKQSCKAGCLVQALKCADGGGDALDLKASRIECGCVHKKRNINLKAQMNKMYKHVPLGTHSRGKCLWSTMWQVTHIDLWWCALWWCPYYI
jgi:hypothetical protein